MGKLNINNGGVDTNKKMPDIDERFGPYTSIEAANAALGGQGRNTITAGLTVGILTANAGVKEYWYQPNKKTGQLELIPKGGNAADSPTEGNFASFDGNGNVVDSNNKAADFAPIEQAVPMGDTEDVGKVLEKHANGFGWVEKPVDGDDAYHVWLEANGYDEKDHPVSEYNEYNRGKSAREIYNKVHNTTYTDAQFIEAIKANYPMKYVGYNYTAYSATSPFDSIDSLDADETTEGKLWFMPNNDNTETKMFITVNNGTADEPDYKWYNMGVVDVPNNVLTEEMVDNECVDGATDEPASAKAVMDLKAKLEGVTAGETKVQLITSGEGQNVFVGKVVGASGNIDHSGSNDTNYKYVEFEIPSNVKSIRFMTPASTGWTAGWAIGHYSEDNFVKDRSSAYVSGREFIVEVKEGETHFRTNSYMMYGTTPTNRLLNFYCYLQNGTSVGEELAAKPSYADMEGLWMWKKNLISQDVSTYQEGGVWSGTSWVTDGETGTYGMMSNPMELEDGVEYFIHNANGYWDGKSFTIYISRFNENDECLETKSYPAEKTSNIGYPNGECGDAAIIYKKHRNEQGEIDESYCRLRLRRNINTTFWIYAQVEVGNVYTGYSLYHSERIFNIAKEGEVKQSLSELEQKHDNDVDDINSKFYHTFYDECTYNASESGKYINFNNITRKVNGEVVIDVYSTASNDYCFRKSSSSYYNILYFTYDETKTYFFSGKTEKTLNAYCVVYLGGDVENGEYIGEFGTVTGNSTDGYGYQMASIGQYLGRAYKPSSKGSEYNREKLTPPNGTKTIAIIACKGTISSYKLEVLETEMYNLEEINNRIIVLENKSEKVENTKLNILAIGDSYTEDAVAYLPYLMHEIAPQIEFGIDLLMESSSSVQDNLIDYTNAKENLEDIANGLTPRHEHALADGEEFRYLDGRSYKWYRYDSSSNNWIRQYDNEQSVDTGLYTIQKVYLETEYDIVLLKSTYYTTQISLNPFLEPLADLMIVDAKKPIKFGIIGTGNGVTATYDTYGTNLFDDAGDFIIIDKNSDSWNEDTIANRLRWSVSSSKKALEKTVCDFYIPVNTAINNAYTKSSIRALGSYANGQRDGFLRYDGQHLQEGLPRQLAAYVCLLKLLELTEYKYVGILGSTYMMDSNEMIDKLSPDYHGSNIGFSDDNAKENLFFIQKCAVIACNNPYVVTNVGNEQISTNG